MWKNKKTLKMHNIFIHKNGLMMKTSLRLFGVKVCVSRTVQFFGACLSPSASYNLNPHISDSGDAVWFTSENRTHRTRSYIISGGLTNVCQFTLQVISSCAPPRITLLILKSHFLLVFFRRRLVLSAWQQWWCLSCMWEHWSARTLLLSWRSTISLSLKMMMMMTKLTWEGEKKCM